MNNRWTVTEETKELGIVGYVALPDHPARRVYSKNVLLCVLKGELRCTYDSRDFRLAPGDLLFVTEGKSFGYAPKDCALMFFFIPPACFPQLSGEILFCSAGAESDLPYRPVRRLLGEILRAQYEGGIHYYLRIQSLWKECLYLLLTGFLSSGPAPMARQGSSPSRLRQEHDFGEILNILNRSYMEPLQLKDLADMFFYTPSHLSRLFQKYIGMHFMEYLTGLRLQKAMPLLLQTAQEIQSIAQKTGFPNARAFSQAFQEAYGMKPSDYRRQLFQELTDREEHSIRDNIRFLYEKQYFDVLRQEQTSAAEQPPNVFTETEKEKNFDWKEPGPVSFLEKGEENAIAGKNCILDIPRVKDLLLDEVQEQIRLMQKDMRFRYINCRGFLSDDMQIFTPATAVSGGEHKFEYSFMLYEKVLRFVRSLSMRMIIQLGNTPSFLASDVSGERLADGSSLVFPEFWEDWEDYLRQLFSALHRTFGDWLLECRFILCPTMEFAVMRQGDDPEEHFSFYLRTFRLLRSILPGIRIVSPVITSSGAGMNFAKQYLRFCAQNGCMPQELNLSFAASTQTLRPFRIQPFELHAFQAELRHQLRLLKYPEDLPVHLTEYYSSFQLNPVCDSCAGAMFPILITLSHQTEFESFGYWSASDCTTEGAMGNLQFSGGRGLLTQSGGKKASYYALVYLSRLGSRCLTSGDGFIVTREGQEIRMLFYYDIPQSQWLEPFCPEDVNRFYSAYPDRKIHLRLTDLPSGAMLITEEVINYECGSAYEKWLSCGGILLDQYSDDRKVFHTIPDIRLRRIACETPEYLYQAQMKPFELRYVSIKWD